MDHSSHDCCAHAPKAQSHRSVSLKAAAYATLHCLTGCVIGEVLGLMIGVSLGLHPYGSMALSTILAYVTGFALTVFPLMKRTGLDLRGAFKAVWIGEIISIGVMEIVMNAVDYHMGGMRSASLANSVFWQALAAAIPAGYIAALPVNAWLIGRQLKKCH